MAWLDRELPAVLAGNVLMAAVLLVLLVTLNAPPAKVPDSTLCDGLRGGFRDSRQAEPAPWPEPAVGTYAR